jgi:hypothetical protein
MDFADLEIGLHRRDVDTYAIEFRFSPAKSDADIRLANRDLHTVQFDWDRLGSLIPDSDAYGKELTATLFADTEIKEAYIKAHSTALAQHTPLRFRLFIDSSANELHNLHWETLLNPDDQSPLATSEQVLFSRYLSSYRWSRVPLLPKSELKALVAIANPKDMEEKYGLAPIDASRELERAKASLGNIVIKEFANRGQATLNNIVGSLREGYNILYLICHGKIINCESRLWLEKDNAESHALTGRQFVDRLKELERCPRLVVLASCQSAGDGTDAAGGDDGALAALGPLLAEIGVPAVLAMQGNVSIETVSKFMPTFLKELEKDGRIDRAVAVARGEVRHRHDAWIPVLFTRQTSGRLWYGTGFSSDKPADKVWPVFLDNLLNEQCTPILGPGLTESMFGSRRQIARRWAETYSFPMADHHRENLPQVAQYVAIAHQPIKPINDLLTYLWHAIVARYGAELGYSAEKDHPPKNPMHLGPALSELISAIGKQRRDQDPTEPHRVLAELRLPIYITTNLSNLLSDALTDAGREPCVEYCRWKSDLEQLPIIYDSDPDYRPSVEKPLVFHLFGRLQEPRSLVLTEDDYFDYLIGITKANKEDPTGKCKGTPGPVKTALVHSSLLFLGFHLEDWNFRILFRSILNQEGSGGLEYFKHLAVQLDPEEGRIRDPERARSYLKEYFHKHKPIDTSIYWGSSEDFLRELHEQLQRSNGNDQKP